MCHSCPLLSPERAGSIRIVVLACIVAGATWVGRGIDIQRVSVAQRKPATSTANGSSAAPFFSAEGRQVIFHSAAKDLVQRPAAGFGLDIFVRDLDTRVTQLVSVSADLLSGGDFNSEAIGASKDGSRILFLSDATNLVPNDTNRAPDLFVRDLVSHQTFPITRGFGGDFFSDIGRPNGWITEDGRRVFFDSYGSQLVSGDQNLEADIFQNDLATGVTTRINVAPDGSEALGGPSRLEAVSASGNRVVFTSMATNLAPVVIAGKTATTVYVRDLQQGSLRRLYVDFPPATFGLVNLWDLQLQAVNVVMSPDGRYVAFATVRRFENDKITARGHIFWFDLETGASAMASGDRNSGTYNALPDDSGPVMSGDGRTIAFEASFESPIASVTSVLIWRADGSVQSLENPFIDALVPPPHAIEPVLSADGKQVLFLSDDMTQGTEMQLYRHRLDYSGPLDFGFQLVAVTPDGSPAGGVQFSSHEFSPDGDRVLFDSTSGRIATVDKNSVSDVFLRELGTLKTELLSMQDTSDDPLAANGISSQPLITSNGRYVVFVSLASNLAGVDENQHYDVFRRDLQTGITELVSVMPDGQHSSNGGSMSPSVSADGRWIAFMSASSNLVENNTNRTTDIFVRDMQNGVTLLASHSMDGSTSGDAPSKSPVISGDGSRVFYLSWAMNLASNTPVPPSWRPNLFAFDLSSRDVTWISQSPPGELTIEGSVAAPSVSGDGESIAYIGTRMDNRRMAVMVSNPAFPSPIVVQTNGISAPFQGSGVWMSEDGNGIVYETSEFEGTRRALIRYDIPTGETFKIPLPTHPPRFAPTEICGLTRDGWTAVFTSSFAFSTTDINATKDVYLARFGTGEIQLVSGTGEAWVAGNGASDSCSIALDGSRVVFRSTASNLVENDFNGLGDIFLHDVAHRTTSLVSINQSGFASNGRASQPVISGDGGRITFVSWADDLAGIDSNGLGDVFLASNFYSDPGDADRDGLPDAWELAEFGNLLADPGGDDDGDGTSNLFEYRVGTKPAQSSSVFRPRMVRTEMGGSLVWDGITGKRYTVEVATEPSGPWIAVGTVQGGGKQESLLVIEGVGGGLYAAFYRIRVQ